MTQTYELDARRETADLARDLQRQISVHLDQDSPLSEIRANDVRREAVERLTDLEREVVKLREIISQVEACPDCCDGHASEAWIAGAIY